MTTRGEFLERMRGEMRKTRGLFPATVSERPLRPAAVADTVRREMAERWEAALTRFRGEFERVGGVFHRVATLDAVPEVVGAIAGQSGARRLVSWHPAALGGDLAPALRARGLTVETMPGDEVDAAERRRLSGLVAEAELGLTGVDLAIAETGTLVLRSGAGRPRSTSLLPACHVAVFDRSVLVESLAQAGVFLEAWHEAPGPEWGAAVNFITGPSRTADIELTLTRGVHGPKDVHAVFVERPIRG